MQYVQLLHAENLTLGSDHVRSSLLSTGAEQLHHASNPATPAQFDISAVAGTVQAAVNE